MLENKHQANLEQERLAPKIKKAQIEQRKLEKNCHWVRVDHKTVKLVKGKPNTNLNK